MANLVERSEFPTKTPTSPMRCSSVLPSLACRRSHLDSASYRTLVRLFSLSLDESTSRSQEPVQDPNPSSGGGQFETPIADQTGSGIIKDSDGGSPRVLGESRKDEDFTNSEFGSIEDFEIDECVEMELLNDMMSDCAKLIHGRDDAIDVNPKSDDSKDGTMELVDLSKIEKGQVRVSRTDSCDELMDEEEKEREQSEGFDAGMEKDVDYVKEIREGVQQETHAFSDPLIGCSRLTYESDRLTSDEEIEEGEIPNDAENSNQSLDQELEERSVCEGLAENENFDNLCVSGYVRTREHQSIKVAADTVICDGDQGIKHFSSGDRYFEARKEMGRSNETNVGIKCHADAPNASELALNKEGKPSDVEAVEVRVKKKRGPLTEERKAKKKKAKKRKRAEKEREQGIKRLKLQPIVKPKEIKYCNFYLKGRCQQGELCKFSHDITPETKSQPCKYFACDSCLKGDDCPFDHELSKYPCHKYMSNGTCSRGDRCKFSHKSPVADVSSPAFGASKPDSILPSGKSNLNTNNTSVGATGSSRSAVLSSQLTMHKPLTGGSANAPKGPTRIPNGIRFLSFGKTLADNANKRKDSLSLEKSNQEKLLADRHNNAFTLAEKSPPAATFGTNMMLSGANRTAIGTFASNESKYRSCGKERVGGPTSLQSEVSEASKILEEFLFCGNN